MASRRVYGRCNMASLLHNKGFPPESIKPFLSQTTSTISNRLNGSSSLLNFDHFSGRTSEKFSDEIDGDHTEINHDQSCYHPEKKRRLTDDQVEYLEKSFQSETKLEPDRKIQLAKELGLESRQVAVWFQNRRARCRMKQLERDFHVLKSSYKNLQIDYDNLLKEKEKLTSEVLRLTEKLLQKKNNAQSPLMDVNKASTEKEKQSSTSDGEQVSAKQEEQSLTVLDYNDAEIAAMVESDYSSSAFEADHSDLSHELSHLDEDEEIRGYPYVEGNSFGYEFPGEEEHDLWLWR